MESRDFGNGRCLRCRIGCIPRRFVWPVSECPQESRPVKAPGNCILEGRVQPDHGWLGCKLNLATDHITAGTSMAIMAAEGVTRERIVIPLDFNGSAFK